MDSYTSTPWPYPVPQFLEGDALTKRSQGAMYEMRNKPSSYMPGTSAPGGMVNSLGGGGGMNYSGGNNLPPVGDAAAQQAYSDYLRRLSQQYQNQYSAIQNQIAQSRMGQDIANLGLNFAGDTLNQQLAMGRMGENIASLNARRQQQMQGSQLDLARNQFQQSQTRLGMQDQLAQQRARMAQSEIQPGYEMAKRLMGARY